MITSLYPLSRKQSEYRFVITKPEATKCLSIGGGEKSRALRAREENQRRVKKKGREGKEKGKGKEKRRKRGKGEKKENKSTKASEEGKNMWGKEMKKMDKGTNAKELRNFGINLIIHDRRDQSDNT